VRLTDQDAVMKTLLLLAGLLGASLAACGGDKPPAIPHTITSQANSYCLTCHKDGLAGAPKTPHPSRAGCTGCHTPR
jgi:hypothetical protein